MVLYLYIYVHKQIDLIEMMTTSQLRTSGESLYTIVQINVQYSELAKNLIFYKT